MSKRVYHSPEELYNELRAAVERLEAKLQHPDRKQAVGYVLSLFALQDQDPMALKVEQVLNRNEVMRQSWARRKTKALLREESNHESGCQRPHGSAGVPVVPEKRNQPAQHPLQTLPSDDGLRKRLGEAERVGGDIGGRKANGLPGKSGPASTISRRLKVAEACLAKGWTLRELADRMDLDPQTVYYWNQGRSRPRLNSLLKLCALLECGVEDLLEGRGND